MQVSVIVATGLIRQYSSTNAAGPLPDCSNYCLNAATTTALAAALAQPNGGLTLTAIQGPDKNGDYGGTVTALPVPPPYVAPSPTVAPGANAGNGATTVLVSGSNDTLGVITATAGTGPAAGEVVKVTFGTPLASAPMLITAQALNVAAGVLYVTNISTTGFSICTQNAPVAGRAYTLGWHIAG